MAKTCLHCDRPIFSNKCCKVHSYLRTDDKYLSQKNKVKKVTPIKSSSKPIKKVSDKLKINLSIYRPIRDKFLEENEECEAKLPGCTFFATEVHHPSGRLGKLLYDINNMKGLCHNCHVTCENFPNLAKSLGLSRDRLSNE